MSSVVRKGVLLRLEPELLERIDRERGAMTRTGWLVHVIERHLESRKWAGRTIEHAAEIFDEDGFDMGLVATEWGDGVLEISHRESGPAASGRTATTQRVAERPDIATHQISSSRPEQGDPSARGHCGDGESKGSDSGSAAGSPPPYPDSDPDNGDWADPLPCGSPDEEF